jgi:hypothetical protein
MAAVLAPTPAGHPFEGVNLSRSGDWPYKDNSRSQDGHDTVRIFQDGLDTGARVLGGYCSVDIHISYTNGITSDLR